MAAAQLFGERAFLVSSTCYTREPCFILLFNPFDRILVLASLLAEKERFEVRRTETGYVYTVYARTEAGRPIIVEVFTATSLGPLTKLTKHVVEGEKWGRRFWTLTAAAYAAAKLASPDPLAARDAERIDLALEISSADAIAEVLSETGMVSKAMEGLIEAGERGLPLNHNLSRRITQRNGGDQYL